MRIAYFGQVSGAPHSGVLHKMRGQMRQWQVHGHQGRLFLLTRDDPEDWYASFPEAVVRRYRDQWSRFRAMAELVRGVRSYRPDLIYHRYFAFYPTSLLLPAGVPKVVEVNTDDFKEYALTGRLRSGYNGLTRRLVLGRADALVFVANELSESSSFASFRARHTVITNGIDLSEYPVLPAPRGSQPRLVFVGSPGQPWQGVDKIVRMADLRPEWRFDIVGSTDDGASPGNITWHGPLDRSGVLEVLSMAHVAIGVLALHRKGLRESSALKNREYLAVGLPVLYGHRDPDVDDLGDVVLRIANTETNVADEIERISGFVESSRALRVPREAIRHLDYAAKEELRMAVFEDLMRRR